MTDIHYLQGRFNDLKSPDPLIQPMLMTRGQQGWFYLVGTSKRKTICHKFTLPPVLSELPHGVIDDILQAEIVTFVDKMKKGRKQ